MPITQGTGSETLPTQGGTIRLPPSRDPQHADPIVIEIEEEGESPRVVDWLGPAWTVTVPINDVPRATVQVRLAEGLLVDDGDLRNPLDILRDDVAIHIRTARASEDQDVSLFRGFVDRAKRSLLSQGKGIVLHLVGDLVQLNEMASAVPQGQVWVPIATERDWNNRQGETHDSIRPLIVQSLPCMYNPDGIKNRDPRYLHFTDPDAGENDPDIVSVPVHTHTLNPDRKSYAWMHVFMDLFYRLRRLPDGRLGPWPHAIRDCNLLRSIFSGEFPYETLQRDVDDPGLEPDPSPLLQVLLGVPRSHTTEGMKWIDALKFTCAKAGLAFTTDRVRDGDNGFVTRLRFLAPGWVAGGIPVSDNELRSARLASPHYTTHDKTWTQVERDNNVTAAQIETNYASVTNALVIVGAPHRHEVTVELRPGWAYHAARTPQVDVNPSNEAQRTAAEQQIGSANWLERYDRRGKRHAEQDHSSVLRRWVVSDAEDMRYTETVAGNVAFPRPWGPFVEAAYVPLDLADLRMAEVQSPGGSSFAAGKSVMRPRPLKNCLTGLSRENPYPPYVEISGDSGATWTPLNGEVNIMRRRLGITIGVEDLTTITIGNLNLPQLYIRGLLRVRVTGTIDGDVCVSEALESSVSLSKRRREALLLRPRDVRFTLRDDWLVPGAPAAFSGGNSRFKQTTGPTPELPNPGAPPRADEHRGDYSLAPFVNALERMDRVQHRGTIEMPGLRLPQHNESGILISGWRAGDELDGIRAEQADGADAHHLLLAAREVATSYAVIASITWSYNPGDGDREPAHAGTTLTLEDPSSIAKLDMESK